MDIGISVFESFESLHNLWHILVRSMLPELDSHVVEVVESHSRIEVVDVYDVVYLN